MKIAVIGAGVAGLTLARECKRRGARVQVFEKSRSVGGRLANRRLSWATVNMGAQYFTARDPRFVAQTQLWLQQGVVQRWALSPHVVKKGVLKPSPDVTRRYVGMPTMTAIAHDLADGSNIHLSSRVTRLVRAQFSMRWQVEVDGSLLEQYYDWVVLAIPPEQAAELVRRSGLAPPAELDSALAGSVLAGDMGATSDDPLAAPCSLYRTLTAPVFTPCWALAVATFGAVDPKVQGVFGDETVSWVTRLSPPLTSSTETFDDAWLLHFSPSWSQAHGQRRDLSISETGVKWLSDVFKAPLVLSHASQHFWRYAKPVCDSATDPIFLDSQQGLAVTGDWLCGGRVEGAYLSGLDVAHGIFSSRVSGEA
ncbi:MAG TPA: FAD-dependent oxidoreductase [Marinagarivorans sp.]